MLVNGGPLGVAGWPTPSNLFVIARAIALCLIARSARGDVRWVAAVFVGSGGTEKHCSVNCSRRSAARTSSRIGQGLDCHYAGPVPQPAPLSTLLSRVGAAFTADFERRLSDAGFPDMTFSLGTNVLRFLRPDGAVRMGSLTEMSGVTKQAISQQVAYLEARGYVAVEPDAADSRAKLVRLTKKGQRSIEAAQSLFAAVERDWRQRFGGDEMRHLRTLLEDILDSMNPSH